RRLEDEPGAVRRPVALRVLPAERELPQVLEVRLALADHAVGGRGTRRDRKGSTRRTGAECQRRGQGDRALGARHGRLPTVATSSVSAAPRFTVMRTVWPGFRGRRAKGQS